MFASPLLDQMTRVHPAVVPVLFVPVIVALGVFAADAGLTSPPAFVGWLLAGYLVWTLTEYWLHRIVFHFEPEHGIGARLHWMMHGVHHDHPNDPLRLVMPPSASIPLATMFALAFHKLLPTAEAHALGAGFFAGYLAYDMTHYYVHHFVPKSRLGKLLRENHMRHHFQDDTAGFGVSAPWWDVVFGTTPRQQQQRQAQSPAESAPVAPGSATPVVPQTRS